VGASAVVGFAVGGGAVGGTEVMVGVGVGHCAPASARTITSASNPNVQRFRDMLFLLLACLFLAY
jgi:hypothetical protein